MVRVYLQGGFGVDRRPHDPFRAPDSSSGLLPSRHNIPPRTVHALRRTFLTRLAESGANPWAVRDLARHRSIVTTEGYLRMNLRHRSLVDAAEQSE